ncbi:MAG: 2-C-methyl-D-erythritol 2,4-cyclodiphosphate synthase [Deltaproteobacteria bacterium]|nr:MAG: 2-C-methyl-D-erythritol 2,4-cyclodiphosphate synthase [Deltaproteobacteria bacterium]
MIRVGFGYDAHRLVPGRPLILGGVDIPYDRGLEGHSDADVLLHAACDALLGGANLGDLGRHFPDTDQRLRGVSSIKLLRQVGQMVRKAGFEVQNLDTTVVAQAPKLAPHTDSMVGAIADALEVTLQQVSVKATTTEGMGFAGSGEGIAAYAVVALQEVAKKR